MTAVRNMLHRATIIAVAYTAVACAPTSQPGATVQSRDVERLYQPARDLGQLFHDVQMARIYPDGKTFVDARPLRDPAEIVQLYNTSKASAGFDLRAFTTRMFEVPRPVGGTFATDTSRSMEEHIAALWPVLTRSRDTADAPSSLIPLPHPYVVPGGRFREVYYWDSYFTMLGLVESGRTDMVRSMLDNFAHLITTVGHIPNGNRTYYLSRSQPPYFGAMVRLFAGATDTAEALRYLDALEREHAFWMTGADAIRAGQAVKRVVKLPNGAVLNRYWDDRPEPRPESYREDYTLAQTLPEAQRTLFYRNTRAAAESGWDFSSRWMRDPSDLRTLETTELIPVDLNCLLWALEDIIAKLRAFRNTSGDMDVSRRFAAAAEARKHALLAAAYDSERGYFYDVRWRTSERVIDRPTLAGAAPLYFGLASPGQGRASAYKLEREFLKAGGFVTTLIASGQQWDAPNGWPPLQWIAAEGLRRYGRPGVADLARTRWLIVARGVYQRTGRMTEKYDVMDITKQAGGGEYPNQDGFGWTNGVTLKMSAQEKAAERRENPRPEEAPRLRESAAARR